MVSEFVEISEEKRGGGLITNGLPFVRHQWIALRPEVFAADVFIFYSNGVPLDNFISY